MPRIRSKPLLAMLVASAALTVTTAPAAEARWLPDNPFDHTRFARGCVKQKHLSFQLRVVARRIFGRKVCIPPMRVRITSVAGVAAAYRIGQLWCLAANMKPGAPLGTLLSYISAARFCGKYGRGWAYVRWR
jgi:hypothetical protein